MSKAGPTLNNIFIIYKISENRRMNISEVFVLFEAASILVSNHRKHSHVFYNTLFSSHDYQVKAVVSIGASDVVTLLDKTYGDEVFPSIE